MSPEEDLLGVADEALIAHRGQGLTDPQRLILRESLANKGYEKMEGYAPQHLKNEGAGLFKILSEALGEKVSKSNFRGALEKYQSKIQDKATSKERIRIDKNRWLESQLQRSKARCIARWQAIGVSEQEAIYLTDDLSVGTLLFDEKEFNRLILLTGEIGIGKSLIGDRLLQRAILKAQHDFDAPIPVYYKASQIHKHHSLEKALESFSSDLGFVAEFNIFLLIDEVDDLGFTDALYLLQEAREVIQFKQNIKIVMISKPIPGFAHAQEAIKVPALGIKASTELVKRISGKSYFSPDSLPNPIQKAILSPLFAVLLGVHLKRNRPSFPESKLHLLSGLVQIFLQRLRDNVLNVTALLTKLAIACIDKGGAAVSGNEIGSWIEQQQLLESKIIVEDLGEFRFPLPILTYWFAAQSLLINESLISDLVLDRRRLERWRYPLVIAIATFSSTQVENILTPIAEEQPAIAADIVAEAIAFQGRLPHKPNQTSLEIGHQIRSAMKAWTKGFGAFVHLTPYIQKDGTLPSIGIRFNQKEFAMVEVAWNSIDADLADVIELPPSPADSKDLFALGWNDIREFLPYAHTSWPWKWTLERIVSSIISSKSIPVGMGYLSREAAWFAASYFVNRHPENFSPIDLDTLEVMLKRINYDRYPYSLQYCFEQLKVEIDAARVNNQSDLSLFPSIQKFKTSPVSLETILAYAKEVYFGACQEYIQLLNRLAPYLPQLPLASILPARLHVMVIPPAHISGAVTWSWYWEPMSTNSKLKLMNKKIELSVRLGEHSFSHEDSEVRLALERVKILCPQWLSHFSVRPQFASPCTQAWLGKYPVTKLAYQWLWDDLKQVSWLTRRFDEVEKPDENYWKPVGYFYSSGRD